MSEPSFEEAVWKIHKRHLLREAWTMFTTMGCVVFVFHLIAHHTA